MDYPLQYLQKRLSKLLGKVKLQQAGGQKAREATPVSSPSNEQFNIVARAIYETVQPEQVVPVGCRYSLTLRTCSEIVCDCCLPCVWIYTCPGQPGVILGFSFG